MPHIALLAGIGGLLTGVSISRLGGLWYDEATHALVTLRWLRPYPGGITPSPWWMKDTYQGTLKSLLLVPVFSVFGASPLVLRATTLALGAVAVFFFTLYVARRHGTALAAAFGALAATDPAMILGTGYDAGPVAVGLALKGLGFVLMAEAARGDGEAGAWALAAGLVMGVGVWDKAHFLWLLMALGPALAAAGWGRRAVRLAAPFGVGTALGMSPFIIYNATSSLGTLHTGQFGSTAAHLPQIAHWASLRAALAWRALASPPAYTLSGDSPRPPWGAMFWGLSAAVSALVLAVEGRADGRREALFWTALGFGVWAIAVVAPLPVKWHHFMLLEPLPQFAALALMAGAMAGRRRRGLIALFGAAAVAASFAQVRVLRRFCRHMDATGGIADYSRSADDAARWSVAYQDEHPGTVFLADDWLEGVIDLHSNAAVRTTSDATMGFGMPGGPSLLEVIDKMRDGRVVWWKRGLDYPRPSVPSESMAAFETAVPAMRLTTILDAAGRTWAEAYAPMPLPAEDLASAWLGFLRAPAIAPQAAELWLTLSERARAEGRFTDAAADLAKALDLHPPAELLLRAHAERAAIRSRSTAALPRGEGSMAGMLGSLGVKEFLRSTSGKEPPAQEVHEMALAYQKLGRYAQAKAAYDELLRKTPDDAGLLSDRAVVEALQGDADAAVGDLRRTLTLAPDAWPARMSLAALLDARGSGEEALRVLRPDGIPDPRDPDLARSLPELRRRLSDRRAR